MSDLNRAGNPSGSDERNAAEPAMFTPKRSGGGGVSGSTWAIAAVVVLVLVFGMIWASRGKSHEPPADRVMPLASYAANLPLSQLAMSESTSLSGGKSTFVDGHIKNTGTSTVTGITVQVLFGNMEGSAPQIYTMPLTLIRTRQPYIDTQSVASSPIKPGEERDFRLIFETIPQNWNMQMPEVRVVGVKTQ